MKTKRSVGILRTCAIMAAGAMLTGLLAGCEEGEGTASLNVTPRESTLTRTQSTLLLRVSASASGTTSTNAPSTSTVTAESGLRNLSLPLSWRVGDPALGGIMESGGDSAVYRRFAPSGVQIVTARDQYGAEGFAVITQTP